MKIGDWGIRVGAVLLACFLWFHAVTEHTYTREVNIRLIVENPPLVNTSSNRSIIIANKVPERILVQVKGHGKDILLVEEEDFVLRLRTEGEVNSRRTYRFQLDQIEKRDAELDVQVEEIIAPSELEVHFDLRVERTLPVVGNIDVQVAPAHVLVGSLSIEPSHVSIVGPRSIVDTIKSVTTDTLRLDNVSEDVDQEVPLSTGADNLWTLGQPSVRVRADVQILADNDMAGVPVEIRNADGRRLRADPEFVMVKVRGGVDVVSNLNPQEDLDLYVNYVPFQEESYPVLNPDVDAPFEILEITPSQVNLVSR
jgi:YbbR domain-containing protein